MLQCSTEEELLQSDESAALRFLEKDADEVEAEVGMSAVEGQERVKAHKKEEARDVGVLLGEDEVAVSLHAWEDFAHQVHSPKVGESGMHVSD